MITVSIAMVTYNHDAFLAQALESILMQEVDFSYQIVIGEDCSTDRTRMIVQEYAERFPEKITPILHSQNVGMYRNFVMTYQACQGRYLAILDGDDYWTDPHKLQKQVEFLDRHTDVAMCAHWADILYQESGHVLHRQYGPSLMKARYTVDDVLEYGAFLAPCSLMVRNKLFDGFPDWFEEAKIADFIISILHAQHGGIGFLDETMAVYRSHKNGASGGQPSHVNLLRNIHAYRLVGKELGLAGLDSFWRGVAKQYFGLCRIYRQERAYRKFLTAGGSLLNSAPLRFKPQVLKQLLRVCRPVRLCLDSIEDVLRSIRIQGLRIVKRWCGERVYDKCKTVYHYRRRQEKKG